MLELMIKMVLCLVLALILGFITGWLLSKLSLKKRHKLEMSNVKELLSSKSEELEREENGRKEKEKALNETILENGSIKTELDRKISLLENKNKELWKIQKELKLSEKSLKENLNAKEYNQALVKEVLSLERVIDQNHNELKELEKVLVKAEEVIKSREDMVSQLEKELKESYSSEDMEELIITKDQLVHIETQLLEYQKEIKELKEKDFKVEGVTKEENTSEKKELLDELDDSAIVKLFGDTYKKIIKP